MSHTEAPLDAFECEHVSLWIHANPGTSRASGLDRLWRAYQVLRGSVPSAGATPDEDTFVLKPQTPTTGMNAVFGKWPIKMSDEEFLKRSADPVIEEATPPPTLEPELLVGPGSIPSSEDARLREIATELRQSTMSRRAFDPHALCTVMLDAAVEIEDVLESRASRTETPND